MNKNTSLTLDLPNFTGPLDLLLHLIRSQEIDIYDIPIARITGQYLDKIKHWQESNLQIAGEYFVMASTLLRIKSQYLLPQNDFDESVVMENEDPRTELVEQLVQYSVFKKISEFLKTRNEELPITVAKEPSVETKDQISPLPLGEITSEQLGETFAVILRRFKLRQPKAGKIEVKETSIEEMTNYLENKLKINSQVSFFNCIHNFQVLDQVISLFMAILEMIRYQKINVYQSTEFSDLIVERKEVNGK